MSRFQLKTTQFDLAYTKLKLGNHDPIYFLMGEDQFLHSHFINDLIIGKIKSEPQGPA